MSFIDLRFLGMQRVIGTAVLEGPSGLTLIDPGPTSCRPAATTKTSCACTASASARETWWCCATPVITATTRSASIRLCTGCQLAVGSVPCASTRALSPVPVSHCCLARAVAAELLAPPLRPPQDLTEPAAEPRHAMSASVGSRPETTASCRPAHVVVRLRQHKRPRRPGERRRPRWRRPALTPQLTSSSLQLTNSNRPKELSSKARQLHRYPRPPALVSTLQPVTRFPKRRPEARPRPRA